ncbi:MAG: XTP/dITP diphosphatase [Deltaproteobacteria bacterium]|nr:XTP/dITP diphosphatase [Candidatus Anaeroferrophillus wilburensis]MBN2888649.1 XTP/dITP diphosphatase [Deltaproteobacteria bacterium]
MPQDIVVATGNQGKLREIRQVLADLPVDLLSLQNFPNLKMPVEDGDSFAANARLKAEYVVRKTGKWVLADDSGLVVFHLGGEPGIYSARYAGPDAGDQENNQLLLARMRGVPAAQRAAEFVCVLVLAAPTKEIFTFEGRCQGRIAYGLRGDEGFGYDPLFLLPPDFTGTMAEISLQEKQQISHRGRALLQLHDWLHKCTSSRNSLD